MAVVIQCKFTLGPNERDCIYVSTEQFPALIVTLLRLASEYVFLCFPVLLYALIRVKQGPQRIMSVERTCLTSGLTAERHGQLS